MEFYPLKYESLNEINYDKVNMRETIFVHSSNGTRTTRSDEPEKEEIITKKNDFAKKFSAVGEKIKIKP